MTNNPRLFFLSHLFDYYTLPFSLSLSYLHPDFKNSFRLLHGFHLPDRIDPGPYKTDSFILSSLWYTHVYVNSTN